MTKRTMMKHYFSSGKTIYECVRGDMYLIDMQKTKGHVSTLNRACWNPKDLNVRRETNNIDVIR